MRRTDILVEAQKIVTKDRNTQYGDPEDNFRTIAEYWNTYLRSKGVSNSNIEAHDVAAMMVLMKTSRIPTSPSKDDHWVDIAGYAACGGGVATNPANHIQPVEVIGDDVFAEALSLLETPEPMGPFGHLSDEELEYGLAEESSPFTAGGIAQEIRKRKTLGTWKGIPNILVLEPSEIEAVLTERAREKSNDVTGYAESLLQVNSPIDITITGNLEQGEYEAMRAAVDYVAAFFPNHKVEKSVIGGPSSLNSSTIPVEGYIGVRAREKSNDTIQTPKAPDFHGEDGG